MKTKYEIDTRVVKVTIQGVTRRFIENQNGEVRIDGVSGILTPAQLDAGIEKAKAAGHVVEIEVDRR